MVGWENSTKDFSDPPAIWKGAENIRFNGGKPWKVVTCALHGLPKVSWNFRQQRFHWNCHGGNRTTLKHVHSKSEEFISTKSSKNMPTCRLKNTLHPPSWFSSSWDALLSRATVHGENVSANGYLSAPILFVVEPDGDVFVKINLCHKCCWISYLVLHNLTKPIATVINQHDFPIYQKCLAFQRLSNSVSNN